MKGTTKTVIIAAATAILTLPAWSQALPVLLAGTDFEVAQGYPAPPAYYDVRTSTLSDVDAGQAWTSRWTGTNGGYSTSEVPYKFTAVERDGTAYAGDQHVVMHRGFTTNVKFIHLDRTYDTTQIQDNRVALSAAIRLDTNADAYASTGNKYYFLNNFKLFFEQKKTGSGDANARGEENIVIEFDRGYNSADPSQTATVRIKGGGEAYIESGKVKHYDVRLGDWDADAAVYAKDTWLKIDIDVDLTTQTFDLYFNDALIGEDFNFNAALQPGWTLDQVRFRAPAALLNGGVAYDAGLSVDSVMISTLPEPGTAILAAAVALFLLRRRET